MDKRWHYKCPQDSSQLMQMAKQSIHQGGDMASYRLLNYRDPNNKKNKKNNNNKKILQNQY